MEEKITAMQPSITDLIRMVCISPVVPAWMDPTTLIAPEQNRTDAVRNPFPKLWLSPSEASFLPILPNLSPKARISDRLIFLHIKDGVLRQKKAEQTMVNGLLDRKIDLVSLGEGDLDIKGVIAAAPDTVRSVIVELDYCNIDMTEAIARSYKYMTQNGFALGNR